MRHIGQMGGGTHLKKWTRCPTVAAEMHQDEGMSRVA